MSAPANHPYNPKYDPLVDSTPGNGVDYAPTYWVATAGEAPELDPPIDGDVDADVVIIGSGFTGLTTAMFLAKNHGIKATVLDANHLAWGCTSRNGGQGQFKSGRLGLGQWVSRWGEEIAVGMYEDLKEGYMQFRELAYQPEMDCQPQGDGHLLLAHRKSLVEKIQTEIEIHNRVYGQKSKWLDQQEVSSEYVNDAQCFGAMLEPYGVGVHPLKLAYGYAKTARSLGVKIHPHSPVTNWYSENGIHYLHTPKGIVKTKNVAVSTGGYTSAMLNPLLAYRYMPILSNSVVTRVLTENEIREAGLHTNLVITDTRNLRFYYRLLPDNRLQMGTRSAITGSDADNKKHYDLLINGMANKFPALKNIQIDYSWWGWVDVSHDMMPRIFSPDSGIFYSLGYGGNGVAYSVHAGLRMSDMIAGVPMPNLPTYTTPLEKHLFTPFRRIGQRLFYQYYQFLDVLP